MRRHQTVLVASAMRTFSVVRKVWRAFFRGMSLVGRGSLDHRGDLPKSAEVGAGARGHLASTAPWASDSSAPVKLSRECRRSYENKVVLVSGAGGSIGSALAREVLSCRPAHVILFELNEYALYEIDRALATVAGETGTRITAVLGSVADPRTVRRVLERYGVHIVLHAAAYKHVPLVEANPMAGLVNNVFGTQTLAEQAAHAGVERFILLSTDKAVRPANVMGASKRLAERVVLDLSRRVGQGTAFSAVRFGNVLESSGSVVPLFREQLARGGPLTVTHPLAERYFMTMQQAVQMVLEAGTIAKGGEVFVFEMGAPVNVGALARQMIEDAGLMVREDHRGEGGIAIVHTGLRAGEKLSEELSLSDVRIPTDHPRIFAVQEPNLTEADTAAALRALKEAFMANNEKMAREVIARWVEPPPGAAPPAAIRRSS